MANSSFPLMCMASMLQGIATCTKLKINLNIEVFTACSTLSVINGILARDHSNGMHKR